MKLAFQLTILILSLFIVGPAHSQRLANKENQETERARQIQKKTYALVEEIADAAVSLKLPENRSAILADVAYLLWKHDPARARNLFWDAYNAAGLLVPDDGEADKKKIQAASWAAANLRRQILQKAAQRDYQLAIDMLRSANATPPELQSVMPDAEQEIAMLSAGKDPKRILEMARLILAKDVNFQSLELLHRLHDEDSNLSAKLAGEMIDKIQSRNLAIDFRGAEVAVQLLAMSRPPAPPAVDGPYLGEPNPLKLTREQRRQLVDAVVNSALSISPTSTLLYMLPGIMPDIQEFAPERVPLVQKKLLAFNQTLNPEQRSWQQFNQLSRNRNSEEVLAAAMKLEDVKQRAVLQQQAVIGAVLKNRSASLREYIETEIKNDDTRKRLLDALNTEQISHAIYRGDLAELNAVLPLVRQKEERARALSAIAVLVEKKGEHAEALRLLTEAQTLVKRDFNSYPQTNALLSVIAAYTVVEPSKAFLMIEGIIDEGNDQISKLLLLDKIIKTGVIQNDEIKLQNSGISLDIVQHQYGQALSALAQIDFERTKAAADRLERPELRLLARLAMAQILLSSPPQINVEMNR